MLLCDDHQALTDALTALIAGDGRFEIAGPAVETGQRAVDAAASLRPDVVLMDVELAGEMTGFQAAARIVAARPSTRVIIVSGSTDAETSLLKAIEAGASGFLSKTEPAERILDSIHAAANGGQLVGATTLIRVLQQIARDRDRRDDLDTKLETLSTRELQILRGLANGLSNDELATDLFISPATVQTHVRNILRKLGVHSKLQAVALAARAGVLSN